MRAFYSTLMVRNSNKSKMVLESINYTSAICFSFTKNKQTKTKKVFAFLEIHFQNSYIFQKWPFLPLLKISRRCKIVH